MYHFKGCVAHPEEYNDLRDMSHTMTDCIILRVVSHTVIDAWTAMPPMGLELSYNGCALLGKACIILYDIELQ